MRRYLGAFVVLGIFAVLLIFVLLTQNSNNSTPTGTAVAATPTQSQADKDLQILSIPVSDTISQLDIKTVTGTTTLKLDNGAWKQTAPKAIDLDSSVISDTIGQIKTLKGVTFIPADKATDLKTFGLDNPSLQLTINAGASGTKTLQFGSANPATKNYYAKLDGDGRVWTVSSFFVDTINGWLKTPPTPAPTIGVTGAPLTPLPSVTPSPTAGATTDAAAAGTPGTPAPTTAGTTTAASTTAAATTAAPSTTAAATTVAPTPTK